MVIQKAGAFYVLFLQLVTTTTTTTTTTTLLHPTNRPLY
jgi:hypothetical protein